MTGIWEIAGQPGVEETTYTYDANGLLTSATNCDGLKVTYEYYTTREPFRVKRVRITGGTLCAYDRTYEYKDCLTVVTDNLNGKKLFYHFHWPDRYAGKGQNLYPVLLCQANGQRGHLDTDQCGRFLLFQLVLHSAAIGYL